MLNTTHINALRDPGLLSLRLGLAVIFLYHGIPKATQWSMAMDKFASMGFPGFLGPIVGIAEVIGGILLIIGLFNFLANGMLAVIITVAIIGVQIPAAASAGVLLPAGLERDLMILVGHLTLMGVGPGKWAIQKT